MRSIIDDDREDMCHYCGRTGDMHKHHIFGGVNRKWSEKYGLFVHLCPYHHNMSDEGIHFNKDMMDGYHRLGQKCFELRYCIDHSAGRAEAHAEFMRIFGRNYL
jgi:hypothetical protein